MICHDLTTVKLIIENSLMFFKILCNPFSVTVPIRNL